MKKIPIIPNAEIADNRITELSLVVSMLKNNIEYLATKYSRPGETSKFTMIGGCVMYLVLPNCAKISEIDSNISTNTFLEDIALAKVIGQQMIVIVNEIKAKRPNFARWAQDCFSGYLERLGERIKESMNSTLPEYA